MDNLKLELRLCEKLGLTPTPTPGQTWFCNGVLGCACQIGEATVWQPFEVGAEWFRFTDEGLTFVFRPTLEEILGQIPDFVISKNGTNTGKWMVKNFQNGTSIAKYADSIWVAAAALLWARNEK